MNRTSRLPPSRLHNSLMALFAVAVASALTLLAARPLPPNPSEGVVAYAASDAPGYGVAAAPDKVVVRIVLPAVSGDAAGEAQAQRKPRKTIRRSRQTLAMPYFSFAARS